LYRVDRNFAWGINISLAGLLLLAFTLTKSFTGVVGAGLALVGSVFSVMSSKKYGPESRRMVFETKRHKTFELGDHTKIAFREIQPSEDEKKAGFRTIDPGYNSGEFPIVSDKVNTWLTICQPEIKFTNVADLSFGFLSKEQSEKYQSQLKFLYAKTTGETLT
jgi:hypothetical protein